MKKGPGRGWWQEIFYLILSRVYPHKRILETASLHIHCESNTFDVNHDAAFEIGLLTLTWLFADQRS